MPYWKSEFLVLAGFLGLMIFGASAAVGCAALKTIVRTIDDIAEDACVLFATQNAGEHTERLQGLSPAEFCDIKENLDPFIEHITRAQQTAGGMAVSRGLD